MVMEIETFVIWKAFYGVTATILLGFLGVVVFFTSASSGISENLKGQMDKIDELEDNGSLRRRIGNRVL